MHLHPLQDVDLCYGYSDPPMVHCNVLRHCIVRGRHGPSLLAVSRPHYSKYIDATLSRSAHGLRAATKQLRFGGAREELGQSGILAVPR